jgi:hypothetical protein
MQQQLSLKSPGQQGCLFYEIFLPKTLRVRAEIISQIFSVQSPIQQDSKLHPYLFYVEVKYFQHSERDGSSLKI